MDSTTEPSRAPRGGNFPRLIGLLAILVFAAGAVVTGLRFGGPALVLWFAFGALGSGILLFWETIRSVLDPNAPTDDDLDAVEARLPSAAEARKRAALRALKDIEFEKSIGRISDEDYVPLRDKYRADARAAMEAMDEGVAEHLARAEALIAEALGESPGPKNRKKARGRDKRGGKEPTASSDTQPAATPNAGETAATAPAGEKNAPETPATAAAASASDDHDDASDGEGDADERHECPSCGTSNDGDATFCKRCGTRIEADA